MLLYYIICTVSVRVLSAISFFSMPSPASNNFKHELQSYFISLSSNVESFIAETWRTWQHFVCLLQTLHNCFFIWSFVWVYLIWDMLDCKNTFLNSCLLPGLGSSTTWILTLVETNSNCTLITQWITHITQWSHQTHDHLKCPNHFS